MKGKHYYIDKYEELIEEDRDNYIDEHGNDIGWDSSSVEQDMSAEEIVGYYLVWYKDRALNVWLHNLNMASHEWETDEEVTLILKYLSR